MNGNSRALKPTILPPWLRELFPEWLKPRVRDAICGVVDAFDKLRGALDPLVPPSRLRVRVGCFGSYIRRERYRVVGEEFAGHLLSVTAVAADSRVLDIGCGCGQVAAALTPHLGARGSYDGFDPDAEAIRWCRENISVRFKNFRFSHADVANTQYNPDGVLRAEDVHLPYADASMDVILLKSVFTHMPARQMQNYMKEIRRLLRQGGRCLASYYLLNDASRACIAAARSPYAFAHRGEGCWIVDPRVPDYGVAYDEQAVRDAAAAAGLCVSEPVHYGSWCGRDDFLSFQDLVIFVPDGAIAVDGRH